MSVESQTSVKLRAVQYLKKEISSDGEVVGEHGMVQGGAAGLSVTFVDISSAK